MIVADGGFQPGPTKEAFPDLGDEQIQISGRHEPGSRRTRKRNSLLPNRDRGPDQSPQTRLRHAPIPAQRR